MGKDLSGLRAIAARRSGMQCFYCRVPTAAEIEHVRPRSGGGRTHMDNLVLACPLCNKRKGTRPAGEFLQSEDWRLEIPSLPKDPREMLRQEWNWKETHYLQTGSRNARLRIEEDGFWIEIRPGRKYPWSSRELRGPDVSKAIWDFLRRHFTQK